MSRPWSPICPQCQYSFDDEETWYSEYSKSGKVHTGDGDESELTCPNLDCKCTFKVVCVHEVKFEAAED